MSSVAAPDREQHPKQDGQESKEAQPPAADAPADKDVVPDRTPAGAPQPLSFTWWRRVLLGTPLPTSGYEDTRLGKILALPVFSSDAISSVAYATQEILLALGAAGLTAAGARAAYTHYTWGVTMAIVGLLAIVAFSYRQTIFAYPNGGGSYIVSKENLGTNAGLIAAAALLIDYVLTVAVSIASGVQNLISTPALSGLAHHIVLVCLVFVVLLTLANLRGQKESGALFSIPTYAFIVLTTLMVVLGALGPHLFGWHLHLDAVNQDPGPGRAGIAAAAMHGVGAVSLFVLLRAFANGCSAMTGTEAISNGIPAFRKPESANAAATLTWMAVILGSLFLGISYMATSLHVVYWEHAGETAPAVIDQISGAVFGRTGATAWLYYAMQFATAAILVLAANTSFADFPRLASLLALDNFLPHYLSRRGDRLVFSGGIFLLGLSAGILLFLFHGSVDRLIPLYALGVFTAFTLSQTGMVRHWIRERGKGWHVKAAINGVGAVTTALVFTIILIEKGPEGAWVVAVLAGILVLVFRVIRRHYGLIVEALRLASGERPNIGPPLVTNASKEAADDLQKGGTTATAAQPAERPVMRSQVFVLVGGAHRGIVPALRYARLLSDRFEAVSVEIEPSHTEEMRRDWAEHFPGIPLTVLASPYRSMTGPLLEYVEARTDGPSDCDPNTDRGVNHGGPDGVQDVATLILPEFFTGDFWGFLLQDTTTPLLKLGLLGRDDVIVTNVRHRICYPADPGAKQAMNAPPEQKVIGDA
jgi:amino acid transporter